MSIDSIVTAEHVERYRNDGVACIRNAVSSEAATELAEEAIALLDSQTPRGRDISDSGDTGRYYRNNFLFEWNAAFRSFIRNHSLAEVAGKLSGADSIQYFVDHLFAKLPGTNTRTNWHQDLPYLPLAGEQIVTLWVALTHISPRESGLQYVRGSHKFNQMLRGKTYRNEGERWPVLGNDVKPASEDSPAFDPDRLLSWNLEPGDLIAHHPRTLHGADGNSGDSLRLALSVRLLGDDVVWDPRPGTLKCVGDPKIPPNTSVRATRHFPVLWPD